MESNCDAEIARMRENNYEKFKSLVRMHLSFELDLNTDEFDHESHEIVYEDKGKMKKWLSKKQKYLGGNSAVGCTSGDRSPPDSSCYHTNFVVHHLKEFKKYFLLEKNLTQEGIFRKTGSAGRQNELRSQLKSDKKINLEENGFSVHDCATVFKGYLAELPEPLLTEAHYPAYSQLASLCIGTGGASTSKNPNSERMKREQQIINSLQLLLLLLPVENRNLLKEIIEILHAVVQYQQFNKMTAENLATLFSPHLICPRNMPPEALHYVAKKMANIIAFMVLRGMEMFEVPVKLATDIRAYFLERKRKTKTTLSPEALDDSISDISTVNTVYTFVDREKTAAAHITNTTDTELAQLYAHIQSLPESSKKRRLIKQFNKQNGQGTPLQFVVMNRLKHSEGTRSVKSFSNSIKKHIFQKGLMSRTPKRAPPTTTSRALFQSPAPGMATTTHIDSDSDACSTPHNTSYKKLHRAPQSIATTAPLHWNSSITPLTQRNVDIHDLLCSQQFQLHAHETKVATTSLKAISETANMLSDSVHQDNRTLKENVSTEIKSVLQSTDQQSSDYTSNIVSKSRYKSEPNLSCLLNDKERPVDIPAAISETTPTYKSGKSITHKLIKGVSMSNLKLPFGAPESTKRLMRSVSSTLKLRPGQPVEHTDTEHLIGANESDNEKNFNEDSNSTNTISSSNSRISDTDNESVCDGNVIGTGKTNAQIYSHQHLLLSHNLNAITTSTPSWCLGRRSMSPITKSTQRMSKAMRESIMTPRSRKTVMLTTAALISTDQSQATCTVDSASFAEKDEEVYLNRQEVRNHWLDDQQSNTDYQDECADINVEQHDLDQNALSSDFKEYLLSRSVLTASLVDSSFSSQSDDFGSTKELVYLDESQLSHSLLYCLDGNEPQKNDASDEGCDAKSKLVLVENQNRYNCDNSDCVNLNNARKRTASRQSGENVQNIAASDDDFNSNENQENCNEHLAITKKLLIVNPIPGETSL